MRRRRWAFVLAAALGASGCGSGGDDDDERDSVSLRQDSFDGTFPGTAWTPTGDLGVDPAAGAPAPSLRIGGGEIGVVKSSEAFPTAEGLTVRLQVAYGENGDVNLRRPDGSHFVEVAHSTFAGQNLRVRAGGLSGVTPFTPDGSFHEVEIVVAPGAAAVTVLFDGVVVADNPAASDPPLTLELLVRGEAAAATRIDEILVTTP